MNAHETWEGMVLVGGTATENTPYQLGDPEEMISFLDEESDERSMGRDAIRRSETEEAPGTYIH
jgi:hypothetical protein